MDAASQYYGYRESSTVNSEHPAFDVVVRRIPNIVENTASERGREYKVKGSTGAGFVTAAPWVAVLDRAVTDKPTKGYYVVYLYSVDLQSLYLSLAFGVTAFTDLHGNTQEMRDILGKSAIARSSKLNLPAGAVTGKISLDPDGVSKLHSLYDLSNIAAFEYDLSNMPSSESLEDDLGKMLDLYYEAWKKWGADADEQVSEDAFEEKEISEAVEEAFETRKRPTKTGRKGSGTRSRYSKESRKVGNAGEKAVIELEKKKLIEAQRSDLVKKIVHEADLGNYPGYDISSYNPDGSKRRIEVKASKGKISGVIMTNNEKNAAEKYGPEFVLAIVENVFKKPTIQYLQDPLKKLRSKNNPTPHSWNFHLWKE
ncbi:MAG: MrcB family domain-containing protein [Candidatus Thalassarchaeaceae archaeon]